VTTRTVEAPATYVLDDVRRLRIQAISVNVNVVATDGPTTLGVSRPQGKPLQICQEDAELDIGCEPITWSWNLLSWL
jgi:hypothetical protein